MHSLSPWSIFSSQRYVDKYGRCLEKPLLTSPKTSGKTLEEIDNIFKTPGITRGAHKEGARMGSMRAAHAGLPEPEKIVSVAAEQLETEVPSDGIF